MKRPHAQGNDAMADEKASLWAWMAETNPKRSLILFAAGTAVGLGIAAYGLFTAEGTRMIGVPPQDVATINGRHILRSDFIAQIQVETALPFEQTTPAQRQKVLNDMVNEELLVQRGLEVDLAASDPDVRQAMAAGVQLQASADVLAQQPVEEELRKYYAEHLSEYAGEGIMAMRDLVIRPTDELSEMQAVEKASAAADKFRHGDTPDNIAATLRFADSGLIERGDLFDFAVKIKLPAPLFAAAIELKPHDASAPIVEAGAVHVLMMEKRMAPQQRSFAEARDAVLQDFKRGAQTRVEQANLRYLKGRADIQIAPDFTP